MLLGALGLRLVVSSLTWELRVRALTFQLACQYPRKALFPATLSIYTK